MREILDDIKRWLSEGKGVALATVIQTWGSSPRQAGSKMAISSNGEIVGSVSGGCVEGAVVDAAGDVLSSGEHQVLHFGVADDTAWEVGLACGGTIDVLVEVLDSTTLASIEEAIRDHKPLALLTNLDSGEKTLQIGEGDSDTVQSLLTGGKSKRVEIEGVDTFIDTITPPPTLIVIGGVHIAIPLTLMAKTLGYRTIVIDPRRSFGSDARFPHVDKLIQAWPQKAFEQVTINAQTAIAALTHDPKLDDPALMISLRSRAFYIGALGSKSTQAKRRERLSEAGLSDEELARLHGPIGLNLGGRTPEEIAVAVLAEIVAVRNGRRESVG